MTIVPDQPIDNPIDAAIDRILSKHAEHRPGTTREDVVGVDYVTLPHRWQARTRQHRYLDSYPNEITLRHETQAGRFSEVNLLLRGEYKATRMVYAFTNTTGTDVAAYRVIDVRTLVNQYRHVIEAAIPQDNHDRSSFIAIDVNDIPDALVASEGFASQGRLW
jgi:hypothetical protein